MKSLDEMPFNDAIGLYYEKHDAICRSDMLKLLDLKNKCPEIFDKIKDAEIRDMIEYAKAFRASDRYKELRRLDLKEKLTVIKNEIISNNEKI